jgi:hypothetical protein
LRTARWFWRISGQNHDACGAVINGGCSVEGYYSPADLAKIADAYERFRLPDGGAPCYVGRPPSGEITVICDTCQNKTVDCLTGCDTVPPYACHGPPSKELRPECQRVPGAGPDGTDSCTWSPP